MPTKPTERFQKIYNPRTLEVRVKSSVRFSDYIRVTPPADLAALKTFAKRFKGRKLLFINATYAGGGVAIMRTPLLHLLRLLGVDAHWYVLAESAEAFHITKRKFHNVLQDVAGPGVELTAADKKVYEAWINRNARKLAKPLKSADVIVIDDWQPSGLIQFIKQHNPKAKIIFRNHIHSEGQLMGQPGTPQHTTWRYVWEHNQVNRADVFVAHPREEFVPPEVPAAKTFYMPATSDLLDDLNRPLTAGEINQGLRFVNRHLKANHNQLPIDRERPYMVLIARFDPSKGMPNALEAYAKLRQLLQAKKVKPAHIPQLVIVGNGSVDDPDGVPILKQIMELREGPYAKYKDDIKVARLPHNDIALNALMRSAALALQPSTKEGFESRVTDAILAGVPVIGSNRGGIPLQITEGRSGYIIDPADTTAWAEEIAYFFTNPQHADFMRAECRKLAKSFNYEYTTVPNAICWLYLSHNLVTRPVFVGNRQWVRHLAMASLIPAKGIRGLAAGTANLTTWFTKRWIPTLR